MELGDGGKGKISICAYVFCKLELMVVDSSVAAGFLSLRVAPARSDLIKMSSVSRVRRPDDGLGDVEER